MSGQWKLYTRHCGGNNYLSCRGSFAIGSIVQIYLYLALLWDAKIRNFNARVLTKYNIRGLVLCCYIEQVYVMSDIVNVVEKSHDVNTNERPIIALVFSKSIWVGNLFFLRRRCKVQIEWRWTCVGVLSSWRRNMAPTMSLKQSETSFEASLMELKENGHWNAPLKVSAFNDEDVKCPVRLGTACGLCVNLVSSNPCTYKYDIDLFC